MHNTNKCFVFSAMEGTGMARRVYVKTLVEFDAGGHMRPVSITWEDGKVFEVEKVTDIRQTVSMKEGGGGMRFTCMIRKKQIYLYYDTPRWFVEARER
jgi:hypothetical protein